MNKSINTIPFVDLTLQHQPIKNELETAINAVISKGDFILGKALTDFESAFSDACGAEYGVGVASGTDAIALGLEACGIGAGDEVLIPANTFIATLIGVVRTGAKPILVDCDPQTALIDLKAASNLVTSSTKAIVPVHLYGQMVSPKELLEFAHTHKVIIFEDAAQAHLASRDGFKAGFIGKAAAFSFYPSKNLGAIGDGGIVVTKDQEVAQKMMRLRNYGSSQKYVHIEYGTNSRLDTLQAAVLQQKLPHLAAWNSDRYSIARYYDAQLSSLQSKGIFPIENHSGEGHVYHLYVIKIEDSCPLQRQEIQQELATLGIQTGIHYPIPCHLQPGFTNLGYQSGDFPHTEELAKKVLSLPMYPGLTLDQVKEVVGALFSLLNKEETEKQELILN
ncbi:MAG: DegT/DnrJ/EryC1/StrS family aminotransferase [Mastigocoleus sp.]